MIVAPISLECDRERIRGILFAFIAFTTDPISRQETISIFEYWSPDDINSIIQQSGGDAQVDKFCITLGQLIKLLELLYEM
jgi:hypothetical protein